MGLRLEYVEDELDMARGWALIACRIENDPWLAVERASPGYIAQQIDRRTNRRTNPK
jgi:hypothetical protein